VIRKNQHPGGGECAFGRGKVDPGNGAIPGERQGVKIMASLKSGSSGPRVAALQKLLMQRGFDPHGMEGQFGPDTEATVRAFQAQAGLAVDGQAGANTLGALEMPAVTSNISADLVVPLFPGAPRVNVRLQLPFVLKALFDESLADKSMVLMALGTIRAETGSFEPIEELVSGFNTPPGGPLFALYDDRRELGNQGAPDGATFKGRGFVQLTGRANYTQFSRALGLGDQLVNDPDLANDPTVAAQLLAAFLKAKEGRIRAALAANDLSTARKLVNGGEHGILDFTDAYNRGLTLLPEPVQIQVA
jgi:peptidoglycan L-alanyl-D-glutamate endopeptidase CwlK